MRNLKYLIVLAVLLLSTNLMSQISLPQQPASFSIKEKDISTPIIYIYNTLADYQLSDKEYPKQAGYIIEADKNITESGKWTFSNNINIWTLELVVKDERSINLYFSDFELEDSDRLYLYSPDKTVLHGAFSKINNGKYFATDFIPGDRIIIEFNTKRKTNNLPFTISDIGILVNGDSWQRGFGDAGNCEVHVNCIEGEDWQKEKNGVVRILLRDGTGTFWCTGSLVNNTKNNGAPYLLTANHCGETADSADYSKWIFYFNYESEDCSQPLFQPEYQSLSGAQLLAKSRSGTSFGSDFKLLKLNNTVPDSYEPYYNGWDRTSNSSPSGVTIHHPQGDLKMISTYESPLVSTDYYSTTPNPDGLYWMVYWAETTNGHGVTEGGSSGSPLFNPDGYIVGTLTGGSASCELLENPDFYGKLNSSWQPANSDSSGQLSYWLDPKNSGAQRLAGTNLDSTNVYANFTSDKQSVLLGNKVLFTNTSFGNITSYQWFFEGGEPTTSTEEDPEEITYNSAGQFDVRLIVSSASGSDTTEAIDYITVLPSIAPVPGNGTVVIAFGDELPENIKITAFSTSGQEVPVTISAKGDNYIEISLISEALGFYFIHLESENLSNTYKVVKAY